MERYLVITEPYTRGMGGEPTLYKFFYADNDGDAVLHVHGRDFDGDRRNEEEVREFAEQQDAANGDGCDFITIINLKTEEVIFGGCQ